MHGASENFIVNVVLNQILPRRNVIEFGSRNVNGSIRKYFPDVRSYIGIDLYPGTDVDIVGDACLYIPEVSPDLVICCSVLEHTPLAAELIQHAFDILRFNGYLALSTVTAPCPVHSSIDGGSLREGEFYQDCTPEKMLKWLKPFGKVNLDFETMLTGDILVLAQKTLVVPPVLRRKEVVHNAGN